MLKPLLGKKVAVLVANGFEEGDLVTMQKTLLAMGASVRIVSMDHGLVNSWSGEAWGLHFAADTVLSSALAADYDVLVMPGGRRSIEKLQLTAHTRRFIAGFMDAAKPVIAMGESLQLLAFAEKIAGRTVAGMDTMRAETERAGAIWSENTICLDGNLLTMASVADGGDDLAGSLAPLFSDTEDMQQAA